MEKYNLEQTGQEVQNILNEATTQSELTAETERAQLAEQQLQNDIDAIEEKIPSGASSSNKLATEEYVDDSVSTATATFRGTFNLVSDLGLTVDATEQQIAAALASEISTADNNDYCFVQIPTSAETPTEIEEIDRYKFNGTAWSFEYELNNSGFTADQWDAINSHVTSGDVAKLLALPTNAELTILLNGKQDVLTFDNVPTENSNNPVKSGGVKSAIDDEKGARLNGDAALQQSIDGINGKIPSDASSENKLATASDVDDEATARSNADQSLQDAIEAILLLIPTAASSLNQLADKAFVNSSIATNTATFRGTFNLVNDLHLTLAATHAQVGNALALAILDSDNNDYCFVQIPTVETAPNEIAQTDRYKFNGSTWEYEYTLNNSGFTSAQWIAINSGITSVLVSKLSELPTNSELTSEFGALTTAINNINLKIPAAAAQNNKLVDTAALEAYIIQVLDVLTVTYNVTSSDGHITFHIAQTDGKITAVTLTTNDIASANDLTVLAGRVTTAENDIDSLEFRVGTNEADIALLQAAYGALTQSDIIIGALPASGVANKIYRVPGTNSYSDYMWNGTQFVLMATYNNAIDPRPKKGSTNLVESGGVFDNMGALDISELNATENPHTLATYADLSAALAAIPSNDYKKGGMSVKFVQTDDNKYVQYRLMTQTFSAAECDWQGVNIDYFYGHYGLTTSSGTITNFSSRWMTTELLKVDKNIKITNAICANSGNEFKYFVVFYDFCGNVLLSDDYKGTADNQKFNGTLEDAPSDAVYFRVNFDSLVGLPFGISNYTTELFDSLLPVIPYLTLYNYAFVLQPKKASLIGKVLTIQRGMWLTKEGEYASTNNDFTHDFTSDAVGLYFIRVDKSNNVSVVFYSSITNTKDYYVIGTLHKNEGGNIDYQLYKFGYLIGGDDETKDGLPNIKTVTGIEWQNVSNKNYAYVLTPNKVSLANKVLTIQSGMWLIKDGKFASTSGNFTHDFTSDEVGLYFIRINPNNIVSIILYSDLINVEDYYVIGIVMKTSNTIINFELLKFGGVINGDETKEGLPNIKTVTGEDWQNVLNAISEDTEMNQRTLLFPKNIYMLAGEKYTIFKRSVQLKWGIKDSLYFTDEKHSCNRGCDRVELDADDYQNGDAFLCLDDNTFNNTIYRNKISIKKADLDNTQKSVCFIGDSIFNLGIADAFSEYKTKVGINASIIGTIPDATINSEGRAGWDSANIIGANNRIPDDNTPIVMYTSGYHNTHRNPFVRVATSDDLAAYPERCYVNTGGTDASATKTEDSYAVLQDVSLTYYIFDWEHYVDTVNSGNYPSHVVYALSVNDFNRKGVNSVTVANLISNIKFTISRILEAAPSTKICILPVSTTYSYYTLAVQAYNDLLTRLPLYYTMVEEIQETYQNAIIDILGSWPFIDRVYSYQKSNKITTTTYNGYTDKVVSSDWLHPTYLAIYEMAKLIGGWLNYR